MYKQVVVVNKEVNLTADKLIGECCDATTFFLIKMLQDNTARRIKNLYPALEADGGPQLYKRADLNKFAEEARQKGDKFFYAKPVDPANPYGELMLCDGPEYKYQCRMDIDSNLFEALVSGDISRVILEAENCEHMQKIVEKAKEAGMVEGVDMFLIRDACKTELTPDETGTRWTCIGFAPMKADKIDAVTGKLQLYKG